MAGWLSYDDTLSRVLVDVAAAAGTSGSVKVQRSVDQIQWADVRGASYLPLAAGIMPVSDYEFTPSVVNFYRVQTALNSNAGFEAGTAPWTTANGAVLAVSTQWAHDGIDSGVFHGDGATANPLISTGKVAVEEGDQLSFSPWLFSSQGWATVETGIRWYDSTGAQLGSAKLDFAVVAGNETQPPAVTATIPAGTATADAYIQLTGTPATVVGLFTDDAALIGGSASTFTSSITPPLNSPWLKNIRFPFANMPVSLSDAGDITRPSRSSTFDVIGRVNPVAVTLPRGGRQFTLTVATTTDDETARVHDLLASGDTVLLQVPGDYPVPLTGYYSAGDTTETRNGVAWSRRWISVALTEVDAPSPDIVGSQITWQGIVNTYATWNDLIAAQATWQDVLTQIGNPADVIVQ